MEGVARKDRTLTKNKEPGKRLSVQAGVRGRKDYGLGLEVVQMCDVLGIPDVNNFAVTKKKVKNAIFEHNYKDMLKELEGSKKLEAVKTDNFREVQNYFNEKSRMRMRNQEWPLR